jgi:hypothetical protein
MSVLSEPLVLQSGLVQMQFDSLGCRLSRELAHPQRVFEIIVEDL